MWPRKISIWQDNTYWLFVIESRLTEEEVKESFEQHYPDVFTGLFDMFVSVLATLPTINYIERHELPRMADFTLLGEAVVRVQGKAPKTFFETVPEQAHRRHI